MSSTLKFPNTTANGKTMNKNFKSANNYCTIAGSSSPSFKDSILLASKLKKIKDNLNDINTNDNNNELYVYNSNNNNNNNLNFDLNNQFKLDLAEHTKGMLMKTNCRVNEELAKISPSMGRKESLTKLVSLKNVIYTENISRQSSIRSLINTTNVGMDKSPTVLANYTKIKHIKPKEYELLSDWDKFTTTSNRSESAEKRYNDRPNTRMGFQSTALVNMTSKNVDYSDSMRTVDSNNSDSSNISTKYYQSEDYQEDVIGAGATTVGMMASENYFFANGTNGFILNTGEHVNLQKHVNYNNKNKFDDLNEYAYENETHRNLNTNETDSILSEFLTNLKFEDNTRSVLLNKNFNKIKGTYLNLFVLICHKTKLNTA